MLGYGDVCENCGNHIDLSLGDVGIPGSGAASNIMLETVLEETMKNLTKDIASEIMDEEIAGMVQEIAREAIREAAHIQKGTDAPAHVETLKHNADGSHTLPDGTKVLADGTHVLADGTHVLADGTPIVADSTSTEVLSAVSGSGPEFDFDNQKNPTHQVLADGTHVRVLADGTHVLADGTPYLADSVSTEVLSAASGSGPEFDFDTRKKHTPEYIQAENTDSDGGVMTTVPMAAKRERKRKPKVRRKSGSEQAVDVTTLVAGADQEIEPPAVDEAPQASKKELPSKTNDKRDLFKMRMQKRKTEKEIEPPVVERGPAVASKALDFLSLHCILDASTRTFYRKVYDLVDVNKSGGLDHEEVAAGLKAINKELISDKEVEYVVRILDMMQNVGVETNSRATGRPEVTFEQFACIAALSEKVVGLNAGEKDVINAMDFDAVEAKMEKAKKLFFLECDSFGEIPLSHMSIMLKAGRIADENEKDVLDRLQENGQSELTFLDFLAHVSGASQLCRPWL